MTKPFEFETIKIKLNDTDLQFLDLHQRIQRTLLSLILNGILEPGVRLPATRTLAKALSVARDTVENAYIQLHRDGFIIRRKGSGSYVSEIFGTKLKGIARNRLQNSDKNRNLSDPNVGLSQRGRLILKSGGITDQKMVKAFSTGLPETRNFPIDVWERLHRQSLKDYRSNVLLHGNPQGVESLRKAIAFYMNLERGAKVSPEQILILSSTRQSLFLCAQLLVDVGQPILMENPGYFGAKKAFEAAGTKIIPIDVDEQGIRTDLLRADHSGANCVYLTPSHQYPTGVTLSLERRLELITWAAENNKWIIEDDYDSEFHYEGLPTACIQGLDNYQRTIYLGTFSKTLYPGLRMGYMAVPQELISTFTYARSIIDGHTPQISQLTLARFMEDGHYSSHIKSMRKLYAGRQKTIFKAIDKYLKGIITVLRPKGGLQIMCLLNPEWSEEETIRLAATAGVQIPGLSRLYACENKKQGWILGYASLSDYEIESAMLRLANTLKKE
ncbi:PLP-dependent aminotransferase family protein [Xenorhabdus sp. Vera]|uniref:MocR-like pyridoxine biosynthesis transcription factor PdxR n=1 Tax=Xenorhabdus koppenhoeferi TaxID=351659 RepID=UPI00198E85AE|nr:PLP-dependent aminotransferase family protein [Xenorhabdus sp. Vera]MBD2812616.1 PLP-dependent aminotransferase family protein [Xenorhabdus sp. Vera]